MLKLLSLILSVDPPLLAWKKLVCWKGLMRFAEASFQFVGQNYCSHAGFFTVTYFSSPFENKSSIAHVKFQMENHSWTGIEPTTYVLRGNRLLDLNMNRTGRCQRYEIWTLWFSGIFVVPTRIGVVANLILKIAYFKLRLYPGSCGRKCGLYLSLYGQSFHIRYLRCL